MAAKLSLCFSHDYEEIKTGISFLRLADNTFRLKNAWTNLLMLSSWWTYSPSAPWLYILHSSIIGASAKGHYLCVFVRMHVGIDVSGVCYRFLSNHHWAPRCRSLSRFLVWWGKTGEDMSCGENKNFRCWAVCKMAVPQCAMAVSIVRQPRTQLQWKVLSGKKAITVSFSLVIVNFTASGCT